MLIAAIDSQDLVRVIIQIVAAGLIFWLLNWLVSYVQIPEPFNRVAKVIIAVVAVLVLINAILTLAGAPLIRW